MKILGVLTCAWLLAAGPAPAQDITFKSHGKTVRTVSVADLVKQIPPRDITLWEPHEKKEVSFKAFAADELMRKIYGDDWRREEEALFTCTDGFQPSLPVSEFKDHQGYLAFARNDDPEFSVLSPDEHKKVPMGPLYLVWENIKDASIRRQGTIPGWPYQVATIDLIRFADRFPRMSPPPGSPASARHGFLVFRRYCVSCHTVNGDGGGKGVELNYPASPTEYWKETWLKKWITDPRSIRYDAQMHAFDRSSPAWEKDRDDVIAYLKAMARDKQRPLDAPEKP